LVSLQFNFQQQRIISALELAKKIYDEFEKDYCFKKHRDWCIYEIYGDGPILREGIKKAGRTLHALCHAPIELIHYRSIGNNLSCNEQILKDMKAAECEKDPGKKSKLEKEGKFILHKEQFMQHYFEIISLRNTLSEEIKLQEKQISTLIGWLGVFGSLFVSLFISYLGDDIRNSISTVLFEIGPLPIKLSYLLFGMLSFLLLSAFIWSIMVSIKLNEAKDVMYICLGVDIDNPKSLIVCE
jgi:hypothetical protein